MTTKPAAEAAAPRLLSEIANEIAADWGSRGSGVSYTAEPYLRAMYRLSGLNDRYFEDSAVSVVEYFLHNASGWRGETAKRVKAELRAMLAAHRAGRAARR